MRIQPQKGDRARLGRQGTGPREDQTADRDTGRNRPTPATQRRVPNRTHPPHARTRARTNSTPPTTLTQAHLSSFSTASEKLNMSPAQRKRWKRGEVPKPGSEAQEAPGTPSGGTCRHTATWTPNHGFRTPAHSYNYGFKFWSAEGWREAEVRKVLRAKTHAG